MNCRCVNCGNNKVVCPKSKRRKRIQPTISSTLAAVSSYEYAVMVGEDLDKSKVTSLKHFLGLIPLTLSVLNLSITLSILQLTQINHLHKKKSSNGRFAMFLSSRRSIMKSNLILLANMLFTEPGKMPKESKMKLMEPAKWN